MHQTMSPRRRAARLFAAALLTTTILAGTGYAANAWPFGASDPTPAVNTGVSAPTYNQAGFADLVDKVKPAVVNISSETKAKATDEQQMPQFPPGSPLGELFRHFQQQQKRGGGTSHALGSGFIIDPAGYIVTNNHVIDGASKITVTLDDGSIHPATVKGHDDKTDLALLKIDAGKSLPFVAFGDSDKARVGDWVVAVGNPFGLGGTVTAGIISGHNRDLKEGPYDDYLQIDAPINPGNSGGPLFNQSGAVIGIDTAIYSPNGGSVGIGFAIPSSVITKVVQQLRDSGKVERGWLGVSMQPLTPALASAVGRDNTNGVLVNDVQANSPAAQAKLQQGDIVIAVDGNPVKGPRDLAFAVANARQGVTQKLTLVRDGKELVVPVTIGSQPKEQVAAAETGGKDGTVGLSLAPLSADARSELGLDESARGVLVAKVEPDSKAADSGLQRGDLIVRVGNDAVTTPGQVADRIRSAEKEKRKALPLLVTRSGTTYYLALELGKA